MVDIFKEFIRVLGQPTSEESLSKYINFVTNYQHVVDGYTEIHHILPQSKFPQYIHEAWNLKQLAYVDHIESHKLLATAYPIKNFLRPLNFMLSDCDKYILGYSEMLSNQTRDWWVGFKQSPEFIGWREKRSNYMKMLMAEGRSKTMSDQRYIQSDSREKVSDHFKAMWADPDFRNNRKEALQEYFNTPGVREMRSSQSLKMWRDRDELKSAEIKNNLRHQQRIHNDAVAGINRDKWSDPEYREKMSKRKPRGSDGSALKARWADPEFRERMLAARKKKDKHNETN